MDIRARHDALVRRLRRGGEATVRSLADEIGVSSRTILRDIGALRDQGFVIHTEAGRGGGIRLDPQSVLTTAKLTVPEVFALLISVAAMRATRTLPFAGLADAGLAKIEQALPNDRLKDLRQILARLYIGPLSPEQRHVEPGPIDPALLPTFETAFLERLHLRFDYTDKQGRRSNRTVEPQAMLVLPPLWYLVAYDPARSDFRHFRMDRISGPAVIPGARFRPRHVPFENDICPFDKAAGRR